jgi:hypothetical protein
LVAQLGRGARAQLSQEVSFRSRVPPSGPPSLFRPMSPAGALRSTGITPLPRYYGPLRLPTWPTGGYGFPSVVDPDTGSPGRVSQVPDQSIDARCPVSPRRTRPMHLLVASRSMAGFTTFGRLAIPISVTRPKGSLALRLTSSRSRAPTAESPRSPPSRLHGERASAMVSTFQLTRSTKLRLTHQRNTHKAMPGCDSPP